MFPTFFDVRLRTGMDRKRAVAGEHFSRAKLLWRLKSSHFLAWNLSWVKPKSNVLDNQITNPLKIDTLTAAILYIHSRHSFYLKGSGLEVLHLLLLPVDEVPVVCEDGSAPLPELQEDCRWNTWIQWRQVFYMTISVSEKTVKTVLITMCLEVLLIKSDIAFRVQHSVLLGAKYSIFPCISLLYQTF